MTLSFRSAEQLARTVFMPTTNKIKHIYMLSGHNKQRTPDSPKLHPMLRGYQAIIIHATCKIFNALFYTVPSVWARAGGANPIPVTGRSWHA